MEQDVLAGGVGDVGIAGADPVRGDDRVAVEVRVIDEEARVGREARVEGETEQPALTAARDLRADVEERPVDERPVAHDPDPPGLLDDEQPAAPVGGIRDVHGVGKTLDRDRHVDRHLRRVERAGGRRGGARRG